jgi:hypothetical protein
MQDVNRTKERIVNIIKEKGPSLPVQVARTINVSPLFTSVFLSELYEDSKLRMSHMKIGSSSLYLLPGQEPQLENFIEHLNPREKDAFFLIKKELVLEDEKQTPVIRVALRAIKDFALPFKLTINSAEKIFWKYSLLSDEEARTKLNYLINPLLPLPEKPKPNLPEAVQLPPAEEEKEEDNEDSEAPKEKPKKKKAPSSDFSDRLKEYLLAKEVEILETILEKKKEFVAKVRTDTLFGKQEYYLMAKDKKKINETDLVLASQKAQAEKMPALILCPGEIDKKAIQFAKDWRNLIKFEKIRF